VLKIECDAASLNHRPLGLSPEKFVRNVFGAARPHYACLFANRRANRMKVLVHHGIGVWLAARRLNQGT
jgi:hypothetical protein